MSALCKPRNRGKWAGPHDSDVTSMLRIRALSQHPRGFNVLRAPLPERRTWEFAPEAALVRSEREYPCHDRGDDPARPKFLGRSRTVPLVLERGLLDAAQKPATEARPPQFQPVDLHDLAWAAHPAEPRGVVGPRRVDRPCHVGDPSQPFNPLMRSV